MDWKGLIFLLLTIMSLHSSVFSCPEECECYHDINLYTANCSSFPTSNENELTKIEVFNLSPMSSVPLALKEGQFVGYKKLKYLSLSNCSIYYIHKKAFYGLKNLIEIDLSFNNIQTLDPLVYQHNNDLTSLILRGNPIKFTANTPFLVSNTIQHLDLGLCSIKNIPRGVFFGVKKIMYMSLDGNRLQTLKYNSLPRGLKYLNIANNMIINVPIELLTSLTNLHRLDLSGNPINCTCPLMDLQDWFSGRGVTFDNEVICASPPQYAGRSWNEVNENELCITETLIDDMQKKTPKKITKSGLKSKEKYYFSGDKNKYLETSALQADEPVHFINEKMDPNAEILFQNDDTLAMGEMMQEKELAKTEKPDDKLENDTDGGDVTENDTNGDEVTKVEDASKKTAFDDIDSDNPSLKEENEGRDDEIEPVNSVIDLDVESNKQSDSDNGSILPSDDQLVVLTDTKEKTDEQNLQNDDVNNSDTIKTEGESMAESVLTDTGKKETEGKTEPENSPVDSQSAEANKKEPIPLEDHDSEYDKAASEALLTDDIISNKEETKPLENAPDESKDKKPSNIDSEDKSIEENISETKVEDKGQLSLAEEISNKPQNEIKEEISRTENEESTKEEVVPSNFESQKKHSSHGSALDEDLLAQEDLIETSIVEKKEEHIGDIDSTEEPVKNTDENNIDTGVIVDAEEKLDEKMGQIKAAESVDEHEKIENSDLKPEIESDLTGNESLPVVSETNTDEHKKDAVPVIGSSNETNNTKNTPDDSSSEIENISDIGGLIDNTNEGKADESVASSNGSLGNASIENNNVTDEESVDKASDQNSVGSKNESESVAIINETEEGTTAAPQSSNAENINVLTAVETQAESKNESETVKSDDHTEPENHIELTAEDKLSRLLAVNKSHETINEEEAEATVEPVDSKESFKSKLNEEMFITDISGKINVTDTDDYDISTTETPDVLPAVEESVQSNTDVKADIEIGSNITETDTSHNNDSSITGVVEIPEPTEETELEDLSELTTVSEPVFVKQNVSDVETEPHEHEHDHEGSESTTSKAVEPVTDLLETTATIDVSVEVTPGESTSGNDTNVFLVGTNKKHNADVKEGLVSNDEVVQEPEPFELQEAHIVLACILVLVLALVLFSVYKCATNKNKSTKRITKDIESNHGTEMQDMASLLPKPSEDDNKSTKKYPEDASSNEKVKLITEDKEEDDNQYQRGNETRAVVEKENTLNNNAPNSPNKPPAPANRTATPTTINPAAPIQRTKVKVAIIPESIPRTPIFVQKTYNNGVSTNG